MSDGTTASSGTGGTGPLNSADGEEPVAPEARVAEEALEAARSDREGAAWWLENVAETADAADSEASVTHSASTTSISDRAFDLIVEFEVSSKAVYEAKYRGAIWPKEASGVTIGIGYDVGYVTVARLAADWDGTISAAMLAALEGVVGIRGAAAKEAAASLEGQVDIPWTAALSVHRGKVIPRWIGLVEESLPNTGDLGPDQLGALVSLTYNRGASFRKEGERYAEMRNILTHMENRDYAGIPEEIRSMKRIWPTVPGLQSRREREAGLFERAP